MFGFLIIYGLIIGRLKKAKCSHWLIKHKTQTSETGTYSKDQLIRMSIVLRGK